MSVISNLVSDLSGLLGMVLDGGEATMKQESMAPAFLECTTWQGGQMTYKQPMDFSPATEKPRGTLNRTAMLVSSEGLKAKMGSCRVFNRGQA